MDERELVVVRSSTDTGVRHVYRGDGTGSPTGAALASIHDESIGDGYNVYMSDPPGKASGHVFAGRYVNGAEAFAAIGEALSKDPEPDPEGSLWGRFRIGSTEDWDVYRGNGTSDLVGVMMANLAVTGRLDVYRIVGKYRDGRVYLGHVETPLDGMAMIGKALS